MKYPALPSYTVLQKQLDDAELSVSSAEIHGLLSGMVAGGLRAEDSAWIHHLADMVNEGITFPTPLEILLERTCVHIGSTLADGNYEYGLLQPDDDAPLDERVEAMALWVQSFLAGFGMQQSKLSEASEDLQELIADFTEISQVASSIEEEGEEAEVALCEINEYLRVGVLLCFSEFGQYQPPNQPPTLH